VCNIYASLGPPTERPLIVDKVPFPNTVRKNMLTKRYMDQQEAEKKAKEEQERLENEAKGIMTIEEEKEEEEEMTKEVIMAVNAECNIEEFNPTTTDLILGKVKAKTVGKHILPFYLEDIVPLWTL
jgi:hypothetical protein